MILPLESSREQGRRLPGPWLGILQALVVVRFACGLPTNFDLSIARVNESLRSNPKYMCYRRKSYT